MTDTLQDAAKRLSDAYRLHRIGAGYDAIGKWIAYALADGSTDNTLYDRKQEAVAHQGHSEHLYGYVQINPGDLTVRDAAIVIRTSRQLYDAGGRMADPDDSTGGKEPIRRLRVEDQKNQIMAMLGAGPASNLIIPRSVKGLPR